MKPRTTNYELRYGKGRSNAHSSHKHRKACAKDVHIPRQRVLYLNVQQRRGCTPTLTRERVNLLEVITDFSSIYTFKLVPRQLLLNIQLCHPIDKDRELNAESPPPPLARLHLLQKRTCHNTTMLNPTQLPPNTPSTLPLEY